jgi:hypothetical protein
MRNKYKILFGAFLAHVVAIALVGGFVWYRTGQSIPRDMFALVDVVAGVAA